MKYGLKQGGRVKMERMRKLIVLMMLIGSMLTAGAQETINGIDGMAYGTEDIGQNGDENLGQKGRYGLDRNWENSSGFYVQGMMLFGKQKMLIAGPAFHYTIANYMRTGGNIGFAMQGVGETSPEYGMNISLNLGVQLPLALGPVEIIPYVTPDIGITMLKSPTTSLSVLMNYGFYAGLELEIPLADNAFLIGFDYNLQGLAPIKRWRTQTGEVPIHGVGVHIGMGF